MFSLRQLEFAVAVAEEGSFTAAARRCHTVQSALSHQIGKIEQSLNTRLFRRGGRQVQLTPSGEVFLRNARHTLAAAERLREEMAEVTGQVRGHISIGKISSLGRIQVPRLLAKFHKRYNAIDVNLRVGTSDVLLAELGEGKLDVVLVGLGAHQSAPTQRLLLQQQPLVLIASPRHPLATRRVVALHDLDGEPLAGVVAGSGIRRIIDAAFASAGVVPRNQYQVSHGDMVRQLVSADLAVALMPEGIARDMRGVVVVPLRERLEFATYACWTQDPAPATRAFVELLREHYAA